MLWVDIKYVNMVSSRLRNFVRKSPYVFNFSCPLCGDSIKNKRARRGYIYKYGDRLNYRCHKCGVGMSLKNLISIIDPELYKDMQLEYFSPGKPEKPLPIVNERPVFDTSVNPYKGLIKLDDLPEKHFCRQYIAKRCIPDHLWNDIYFTSAFYTWTGHVLPGRYKVPKDVRDDEPRLVIPMRNMRGELTAFQGRALKAGQDPKYIYVALTKDEPLIWGLDKIDPKKRVYVFEGPIDAMFIPNAIAVGGGDIASELLRIDGIPKENFIVVYDNEPRKISIDHKKNKYNSTAAKIEKAINIGFSVCIWPEMSEKDVNDMVMKNIKHGLPMACQYVYSKINEGVCSGPAALIALRRWNKISPTMGMEKTRSIS